MGMKTMNVLVATINSLAQCDKPLVGGNIYIATINNMASQGVNE